MTNLPIHEPIYLPIYAKTGSVFEKKCHGNKFPIVNTIQVPYSYYLFHNINHGYTTLTSIRLFSLTVPKLCSIFSGYCIGNLMRTVIFYSK